MGNCMSEPDGGRAPVGGFSTKENGAASAGVLGSELSGSVEKFCLTLGCNKLPSTSTLGGGIVPFVVVYMSGDRMAREMAVNKVEIGRTELLSNAPHPQFFSELPVDWRFDQVQQLHLEVYDADPEQGNDIGVPLDQHEYLGGASCMLADVLASPGTRLTLDLSNMLSVAGDKQLRRNGSTVTVTADKEPMQNSLAVLRLRARNLPSKDGFFGQTDPFLRLRRTRESGASYEELAWHTESLWDQATPCYKTEVVMNSTHPSWKPMYIGVQALCCGDVDRPIVVEVRDWDTDGSHDVIGYAVHTFTELERLRQTGQPLLLTDPQTGRVSSGELYVEEARLEERPSFLDFVLGGTELNFLVAIDFTATNGEPSDPKSLHWLDPEDSCENQYQAAIRAVGEVIESYDSDRLFPVFGFGGKFPTLSEEQCHCVNICPGGSPVQGVEGVLDAYNAALTSGNVQLHGPTRLGPVLSTASRWAEEVAVTQDNQKYFVLLVLTDGGVTDYGETMRALVEASHLPLSVLMVGVGDGNFGRLEYMDGEGRAKGHCCVDEDGNEAVRDIVQFAAFREVGGNASALASKLLQELPGQVLDYFGDRDSASPAQASAPFAADLSDSASPRSRPERLCSAQPAVLAQPLARRAVLAQHRGRRRRHPSLRNGHLGRAIARCNPAVAVAVAVAVAGLGAETDAPLAGAAGLVVGCQPLTWTTLFARAAAARISSESDFWSGLSRHRHARTVRALLTGDTVQQPSYAPYSYQPLSTPVAT